MIDIKPEKAMKSIQEEFLNPKELEDYRNRGKSLEEFIELLKSKFDFSNDEYSHTLIIDTTLTSCYSSDDSIDYFYCLTERPEADEEYENRLEELRLLEIENERKLEEKRINDEILKQAKEKSDQQYVKNSIINNFNEILHELYENFTNEEIKDIMLRVPYKNLMGKNKKGSVNE